jgi:hypothetical protein
MLAYNAGYLNIERLSKLMGIPLWSESDLKCG